MAENLQKVTGSNSAFRYNLACCWLFVVGYLLLVKNTNNK
jgi:hypothetical protein